MSHPLPNMIESTLQKIRDMVDVNSVVGDPITTPEGVTILPICKIRYGFGGGGADFANHQYIVSESACKLFVIGIETAFLDFQSFFELAIRVNGLFLIEINAVGHQFRFEHRSVPV